MVVDLRSSCVAQYKLEENEASTLVVDSRDNYNAVASRNTNNLFDAAGKIGGCFNFAGVDYVLVPGGINSVFKSSFSVNFWLHVPDPADTDPDTQTFCGVDNGTSSFLVWPEGQGLYLAYNTGPAASLDMYNAAALVYNTWQMITVTMEQINPTTVEGRLYVNGQLAAAPVTYAITMSNWTSEIPFGIGAENFIETFPTLGKIDNFCIFDTVLTVDEIAFLYNDGDGTEALNSPEPADVEGIDAPVITGVVAGTDSLTVTVIGDAGVQHTVLYKLASTTNWSTGGTRFGDGVVVVDDLLSRIYHVIAYSTKDGLTSIPSNQPTVMVGVNDGETGSTLRSSFAKLLIDDAKLVVGGTLGNLLGKHAALPYGVYYISPPKTPNMPFITYQFLGGFDKWVEEIAVNITAYANNFDLIHARIRELLDGAQLVDLDDCRFLRCKWDWSGPDLWDDNLKTYCQTVRYLLKVKR